MRERQVLRASGATLKLYLKDWPMLEDSLRTRSRERNALLARMHDVLAADQRVRASWIEGSVGCGEDDAFSDLDLGVVIADHDVPVLAGAPARPMTYTALTSSPRARFVAAAADPLLVMEAPHNAPQGGAFLSTFVPGSRGPHGIDWIWHPLSTAQPPPDCRMLFDRRAASEAAVPTVNPDAGCDDITRTPFETTVQAACSFWAMLLWSAKGVARAPDAAGMPLLRYVEADLRRIEEYTGSAQPERPSEAMSRGVDKVRLLRGHAEYMQRLSPQLSAAGIVLPLQVPRQVEQLLDVVEAAVQLLG